MMNVHYRALYVSNKVDKKKWTQQWWDAHQFIKAVKEGAVNGYFHVPGPTGNTKINKNNVGEARRLFGRWLLDSLAQNAPGKQVALIPIPASDAVVGGTEPYRHTVALTQSLAGANHNHEIHDILRFTEVMEKASHGGPRKKGAVYCKLDVRGALPARPVVIVDDVLTGGGHMRACKRILEEQGGEVLFGIVCGRTVNSEEDLAT